MFRMFSPRFFRSSCFSWVMVAGVVLLLFPVQAKATQLPNHRTLYQEASVKQDSLRQRAYAVLKASGSSPQEQRFFSGVLGIIALVNDSLDRSVDLSDSLLRFDYGQQDPTHQMLLLLQLNQRMGQDNYPGAVSTLQQLKNLELVKKDPETMAMVLFNLLRFHLELQHSDSVGHYIDAVLAHDEQFQLNNAPQLYLQMAQLYVDQSLYEKGIAFAKKVETFDLNLEQRQHAAYLQAIAHFVLENNDTCLALALDLSNQFREEEEWHMFQKTGDMVGGIYERQNRFAEAIAVYSEAADVCRMLGDSVALSSKYANVSKVYMKMGDFKTAYFYASRGMKLKRRYTAQGITEAVADNLALIHAALRQMDSARYYQDLSDSITLAKQDQSYDQFLSQNEAQLKVAEKDVELARQEQTIATYRLRVVLVVAILVVTLILGLLALQWSRSRQRQQFQAKMLAQKQASLNKEIMVAEQERGRISKELHDGIGQELGALQLNLRHTAQRLAETEFQSDFHEIQARLKASAEEVRSVSHRMMPRALVEKGLAPAAQQLVDSAFRMSEIDSEFELGNQPLKLPKPLEINLYRILQELLNNVTKHSKASKVAVQLYQTSRAVVLHVEDDGVGMANTQDQGHGMSNILNRVNMFDGQLNIESLPRQGTSVMISIGV